MSFPVSRRRLLVAAWILMASGGCRGEAPAPGEAPVKAPTPAAVEAADLVVKNGKIVTLDPAAPEVRALAARGGKIVALGDDGAVAGLIGPATEVIDLEGRLAIPGFVEGHAHFTSIGASKLQLDLRTPASWEEIVALVAAAAKNAEPGQWIRGRGWHQEKWTSKPEPAVEGVPVHAALSAVSPDNPVFLKHASGHAAFVNAAALKAAGIDDHTPDPDGGEIVRDAKGHATGMLRETAQRLVQSAAERDTARAQATLREEIRLATEECLKKGVTSLQDAGSSMATIDVFRELAEKGELGVRLWVMLGEPDETLAPRIGEYAKLRRVGDARLTVGGIKRYVDGALGSHGAWLLEPYADMPKSSGLATTPAASLDKSARLARDHGLQLCVHAIGDRGNREVLDVFERVLGPEAGKLDHRFRVEHAQHLDPADIPRFARLGAVASMQAIHATSDGPWVVPRLGERRAKAGAYVWRALKDAGAVVTNGTDAPVEDVSPIQSYHAQVARKLADGTVFFGEQRLSRIEALRAYTLDAAWAAFEDDLKGSLVMGKLADVVVLSRDILTVAEDEIPGTEVELTIVGGKVAHRASGSKP